MALKAVSRPIALQLSQRCTRAYVHPDNRVRDPTRHQHRRLDNYGATRAVLNPYYLLCSIGACRIRTHAGATIATTSLGINPRRVLLSCDPSSLKPPSEQSLGAYTDTRHQQSTTTVGLALPEEPRSASDTPALNKPLQSVLSECGFDGVRRTRIQLLQFVELMRGQTREDYRPNKCMVPGVLQQTCAGYQHYDALLDIAAHGARVPLSSPIRRQHKFPANHKSANNRYHVLVKNIRKEQDNWRCFVLDLDILEIWKEVHISPFGVVDKGASDPLTTGRTIHDLSFPVGHSLNDHTDTSSICTPVFERCDAIAKEILSLKQAHPTAEVKLQAGDVNAAFRNVCTHSDRAFLFGGRLEQDNALVIDTSTAFRWSGSPATYGVVGGAIAFSHGRSVNDNRPDGMFNYYWVDDHVNVAVDVGSNCEDAEQSLRHAMTTILGPDAVNEDKFTS